MPTIGDALDAAARALGDAGVPEPRRDAQVLLARALGAGRETVLGHSERLLTPAQHAAVDAFVERRRAREPVAYILGRQEFWSLDFLVTRDTIIPRPDSETVVEAALAEVADRAAPLSVLDLGTGCGCLLLALLSELPGAWGVGIDVSAGALDVARSNAARLGLAGRAAFVRGDWGRSLGGRFDSIVVNPPYVGDAEIGTLAPEITAFEPRIALAGGAGGLAAYRDLAADLPRVLAPGGAAVLEVGAGQAASVAAIVADDGLVETGRRRDLAGIERCIVVRHRVEKIDVLRKRTWKARFS